MVRVLQKRAAAARFDPQRTPRDHYARRGPGPDRGQRVGRDEGGADDRRHTAQGGAHRRGRRRVHPGRQRGHAAELRHALCQVHAVLDQEVPHLRTGRSKRVYGRVPPPAGFGPRRVA